MEHQDSLRGVGIASPLEQQRTYAIKQGGRSRYGLMVPEAFVRGIRDLGYRSNGDAVAELVDNAIQAWADRVDVLLGYAGSTSSRKPTQLAVVDNGHGMEPRMIRMAVMWGGTHRENDRSGLGRFGFGLPCASVSLGRRFTVLSKIAGAGLYAVELDLDAISTGAYTDPSGDIVVPPPRPAQLPAFVADHIATAYPGGWRSGTVVLIDKLDRLQWNTSQGLRDNISRQLAVTYHKLRGGTGLFVDGVFVDPVDPLFLTPDFNLFALDDDRAQAFDPVRIDVHSSEKGAYQGAVTLRYAWLPPSFGSIDKNRDAVGVNANRRFATLKDYHGIIFSRNGRLIDVQTRTPWTSFINNDRYIKVEVEFSASLDEAFGVTTSKQQVTVSRWIWERLREAGMPKAIEQLRSKVKEAKAVRRVAAFTQEDGRPRPSEQAMGEKAVLEGIATAPRIDSGATLGSTYRMAFEHLPNRPFFRASRRHGARTLYLNTAHGFYASLYDAPGVAPAVRSALEVLLFTAADVMLEGDEEALAAHGRQIARWSDRLNVGLASLTAHLGADHG